MLREWEDAIRRGDAAELDRLIRDGADPNARDRYAQTGLMIAAQRGDAEVVRLLVKHGADLNVTAKHNLSALMLAIIGGHENIARELVAVGADLEARGSGVPGFSGKTAHDLALERGMKELVELIGKR